MAAAAAREGGGAGEEADVVNPIVFFDITLGGEFCDEKSPQFFFPFFLFISSPFSPLPSHPVVWEEDVCVCVCACVFLFFLLLLLILFK